jgi:hypothetical protein
MKILMRKTFVNSSPASNLNFEIHSLEEEEATIASPIVHNILQEARSNKRRNMFTSKKGSIIAYLRNLQQQHSNREWFVFKKWRMIRSCTCLLHRVSTLKCPYVVHLS